MSRPRALAEVSSGARETEEALASTTARLKGIISSAMDAIISTDSRQRILLFNPAAEKMFGVSAQQALGQRIDRFIPKRFRAAHSKHVEIFGKTRVNSRRMEVLGPLIGLRANGQEFPVEASISQVEVSGEKLFTVILRDVTQREQADAERAKLAAIVESQLLERGILSAIEQEQKRMGRDLHDGLCQLLTAAKFKTTLLEHKLARKSLLEASEARALEGQLNQAIEQAHGLAHGLNPVKLVARGLMSALEELAAGVESAFHLRCVCHFPHAVPVRDPITANHVYRIAQEAIQNAVKHSKAKTIRIELKELGRCIVLRVEDDGVGFPGKVKRKAGMGLQNMQARAAILGALLDIRPRKEGGTVVTCRLRAPAEVSKG